ncbi:heparan-alpha-glucosaminide N-acetyltransferase [Artemisia annua]|uniref:Heparan-alpha-glucosaminide N-acetyltransferase n=1 Tax=Artemisia annua TaxID=35608 RepID=A0A2U1LKV6_ARTAN|nr:heparan-alpha-glucosaminide N-acetyltransferase [Artemisia annua]
MESLQDPILRYSSFWSSFVEQAWSIFISTSLTILLQASFAGFINIWYYDDPHNTVIDWIRKHIFIGVWHSRKVGCHLPASREGWDNKMKGKRSIGSIFTRPVDRNRDPKRAVQKARSIVPNTLYTCFEKECTRKR